MFCVQRRVVEAGEGTDQRVGGDHAADQVVAHRVGDGVPDRLLDYCPPCGRRRISRVPSSSAAHLLAGGQRFEQRGPESVGHQAAAPVELGESRSRRRPRRSRRIRVRRATRRAVRTARPLPGRGVRRKRAPGQPHRGAQVLDDARRQQADQVRIPRHPDLDTVEGLCRHRGPTDVAQPLQHPHPQARAGQVAGRDQAVVAAANDDDVDGGVRVPGPSAQPAR